MVIICEYVYQLYDIIIIKNVNIYVRYWIVGGKLDTCIKYII